MSDQITEEQVRHVAKLARLALEDDEVVRYTEQLTAVLNYVAKLNELDVDQVEPMHHPMGLMDVLRADKEKPGLSVEDALRNAPEQDPPFFGVPKVLGDGPGA